MSIPRSIGELAPNQKASLMPSSIGPEVEGLETMNSAWARLVSDLLFRPAYSTCPRGQQTFERMAVQLRLSMEHPLLTVSRRKLGYKFAAAEAWWILSGLDDVASIEAYSKEIASFSDDGQTFFGAYGPKVVQQLEYVTKTLARDPASRQAVISIWRENPPLSKDIPCTLSLQFLIRDSQLHLIVTMRSSDVWLGLPYDVFTFTMIAAAVMLRLNHVNLLPVTLGSLTMQLGSSHLYERNAAEALACYHDRFSTSPEIRSLSGTLTGRGIETPSQLIEFLAYCKDCQTGALNFMSPL